jgi:putative FmdB family regulatory protein
MPIYEYRCSDCGREFEVMQKFSDEDLTECTHCSGTVEKLMSRSSFHLKGGGWHADGYSKAKEKGESKPKECDGANKPECAGCPSSD